MAIFELDGEAPDLPPDGRYWIADSAIVIGRVRCERSTKTPRKRSPAAPTSMCSAGSNTPRASNGSGKEAA